MDSDSSDYEPEYEIEQCIIGPRENNTHQNKKIELAILSVMPPPLEYLSLLRSKEQEISGRKVWCGSILLSNYLLENRTILKGKRILELGCGTGILGMAMSSLFLGESDDIGPKCIAMTDGDKEALKLLYENIRNNNIPSNATDATRLYWGDEEEYTSFSDWCTNKWPRLWEGNKNVTFDTIIAGDVMYKSELPILFFQTIKRFLSPEGILYLCHVPRSTVTHDIISSTARKKGFCLETVSVFNLENIERNDCPLDDFQRAVLYKISFNHMLGS